MAVCLYMLIGVQGSGKSTWARQNAARLKATIVASDEIRNELEAVGVDPRPAGDLIFDVMDRRVDRLLAAECNVIADATHVRRAWRSNVLAVARRRRAWRVAVWFDLPLAMARARNARKPGGGWGDRVVAEAELLGMAHGFEPPGNDEFDEVWRLGE